MVNIYIVYTFYERFEMSASENVLKSLIRIEQSHLSSNIKLDGNFNIFFSTKIYNSLI